ncbi:single-stranded DNA-binding protein [Thalassotalea ponticola]|uniref:single-stranded DNA-binding protein n=1 Tax=Thalassotalea ponticola TaxID=1523392 RepID=UPI0025B2EBA6|nr:single-stranded DNA-binding protein [Thalassotalea ponticola]MDN3652440.1 single-stranded DNA-binding protein [Thalassotalea ponticola]
MTDNSRPIDKKQQQKQQCHIILAGNLVAKPEIRYRANPVVPVAEFVIATNHSWFDKRSNSYKDWTSYHACHFEGQHVEDQFLFADKGQLVLIHGALATSNKRQKDFVQVGSLSLLGHGVHNSVNQVICNATLQSDVKLVQTENQVSLAEFTVSINEPGFIESDLNFNGQHIERLVHLWGKAAEYFASKASIGQQLVIEGRLNYVANNKRQQFIDAKKAILCTN